MDLQQLVQLVGPTAALCLIGLLAFAKEKVFTKAAMLREREEKQEWKQMALQGVGLVEKAVATTKVAVKKTPIQTKRGEEYSDADLLRMVRERGLVE